MLTISQKSVWIFLLVCLISFNGYSATRTWTGNGSDNKFTNPANWLENMAPVYGDDLIFPVASNQYLMNNDLIMSPFSEAQNFRTMTFNGGNYIIGGSNTNISTKITVNGGTQNTGNALVMNGEILVAQGATFTARIYQRLSTFSINGEGLSNITLFGTDGGTRMTKLGAGTANVNWEGFPYGSTVTINGGRFIGHSTTNQTYDFDSITVLSGTLEGSIVSTRNLIINGTNAEFKTPSVYIIGNLSFLNGAKMTVTLCDSSIYTSPTDLTNAILNVTTTCNAPVITLIHNLSPINNFTTHFRDYPEGAPLNVNGKIYRITYFGGRERNVLLTRKKTIVDFEGDGKTDLSIFRSGENNWYLFSSLNNGYLITNFGLANDKLVPADYDGDDKTDIAVFRSDTWRILRSRDGLLVTNFGLAGDIPVPADYDNDGKDDVAIYREGTGGGQSFFYYRGSLNNPNNNITFVPFGMQGDKPVVGDFDVDGKTDFAVYRPSVGTWYISLTSGGIRVVRFGIAEDKPVIGDYDGDGISDIAVYRPSAGVWHYLHSRDNSYKVVRFGLSTDVPSVGDYDGDGKSDIAIFRPTEGNWYILQSSDGAVRIQHWGQNGDISIPSVTQP